jgi:hypothetical protein
MEFIAVAAKKRLKNRVSSRQELTVRHSIISTIRDPAARKSFAIVTEVNTPLR